MRVQPGLNPHLIIDISGRVDRKPTWPERRL